MGILSDDCDIDIFIKFHVFSMDSEDFHAADFIRHSDIDFSVKSSEAL